MGERDFKEIDNYLRCGLDLDEFGRGDIAKQAFIRYANGDHSSWHLSFCRTDEDMDNLLYGITGCVAGAVSTGSLILRGLNKKDAKELYRKFKTIGVEVDENPIFENFSNTLYIYPSAYRN